MELFQRCYGLLILALLLVTIEATEDKGAEHQSHVADDMKNKPESTESVPERENPTNAMPYVESSQFRKIFPKTEATSASNSRLTKTPSGKYIGMNGKNLSKEQKEIKVNMKNPYIPLSRKKAYETEQTGKTISTIRKNLVPVFSSNNGDVFSEEIAKAQPIGFVPLIEEFPSAFVGLPSNEEYDRNTRFMHSILYGFNTDF